jgi:peroxiredoxin Q/BCP
MKLTKGQKAPNFKATDIWGNEIDLSAMSNQKILLTFFRYAECALCNLRVSELKARQAEFIQKNIQLIAVFESPADSLQKSIANRHGFEFPILADEQRNLYNLYGVQPSWFGILKTMNLKGIKSALQASKLGYSPAGKIEGTIHQIPADFLIDENGNLELIHYGTNIIDHISLEKVLN